MDRCCFTILSQLMVLRNSSTLDLKNGYLLSISVNACSKLRGFLFVTMPRFINENSLKNPRSEATNGFPCPIPSYITPDPEHTLYGKNTASQEKNNKDSSSS